MRAESKLNILLTIIIKSVKKEKKVAQYDMIKYQCSKCLQLNYDQMQVH